MNLLSPLSLLLLLPAGGAIALLYLLRVKRRDRVVSSVMFWQAALADTRANAPFQKLKRNLLLFLQLLAVLLLALALARPFRWAEGLGGKATTIVLDASASMNAGDETGGRFAAAVRQAEALVSQKDAGDAVAVVVAGTGRPVVLSPLTTDRAAILRALRAARATDAPSGDMAAAIQLGAQLVAARAGAQVLVVSDGAFPPLEDLRLGGVNLRFLPIGKRARNIAVTAFDVRDAFASGRTGSGTKTGLQAFVTVQNFGEKAVKAAPLELRAGTGADDDALVDARALDLAPGEAKSVVFDNFDGSAQRRNGAVVSARLDINDDLEADNAAYAVLPPEQEARVLLVTSGNPFLLRALGADQGVALTEKKPAAFKPGDVQAHDVVIFDGDALAPPNLPPGRYLFWGTRAAAQAGKNAQSVVLPVVADGANGDADRPQVLDWDRTHPLLRFTDLPGVKLLRAHRVQPAPWARAIAETEAGPLIVAGERGETRVVYVGFSLFDSDMPLRVTFPIFVSNCVRYLSARGGEASQTNGALATRPGSSVAIAAPPSAAPLTVTPPGGGEGARIAKIPPSGVIYDNTPRVGVYRVSGRGGYGDRFAVSLLSPEGSNTRPVARPTFTVADGDNGKASVNPVTQQTTGERDLLVRREWWPWAVAAVLLALVVEWAAYHRQGRGAEAMRPIRNRKSKEKKLVD